MRSDSLIAMEDLMKGGKSGLAVARIGDEEKDFPAATAESARARRTACLHIGVQDPHAPRPDEWSADARSYAIAVTRQQCLVPPLPQQSAL
jgi:hypothetical protein